MRIAVVEADDGLRQRLLDALRAADALNDVRTFETAEDAILFMRRNLCDALVIADPSAFRAYAKERAFEDVVVVNAGRRRGGLEEMIPTIWDYIVHLTDARSTLGSLA